MTRRDSCSAVVPVLEGVILKAVFAYIEVSVDAVNHRTEKANRLETADDDMKRAAVKMERLGKMGPVYHAGGSSINAELGGVDLDTTPLTAPTQMSTLKGTTPLSLSLAHSLSIYIYSP